MSIATMKRRMIFWLLGLGLLTLTGLHPAAVASSAAPPPPLRQTSCTLPATVTTADELYDCITAANAGSGTTITLGADIDLTTLTTSPLPISPVRFWWKAQATPLMAAAVCVSSVLGQVAISLVNQTTLKGGFAGSGGAIFNDGAVSVFNSTLSGNSLKLCGGAIYSFRSAT